MMGFWEFGAEYVVSTLVFNFFMSVFFKIYTNHTSLLSFKVETIVRVAYCSYLLLPSKSEEEEKGASGGQNMSW